MNIKVLYEDNHIIAVVKPAGMLTQSDSSGEKSLMEEVKEYLKRKYQKPGNVFLGLVHRLDKPVSGIVLFGKTSKGSARLSEQFRKRTIQKTYHAIVVGRPPKLEGVVKNKVGKISLFARGFTQFSQKEILKEIKKMARLKTAELFWQVLKTNNEFSLLKIEPKTGRFHQVRIQLSNLGCPILGDLKYTKPAPHLLNKQKKWKDKNSIALCANKISFTTATTARRIVLEIPLPKEWKKYID